MQQSAGRRTAGIAAEDAVEALPRESPAYKGRDADGLRAELPIRDVRPDVAWKSKRRAPGRLDQERHALRSRIERMTGFPKQFRRLATPLYGETAGAFLSFVLIAVIHRRMRSAETTFRFETSPR